jgi:hypothetical protein
MEMTVQPKTQRINITVPIALLDELRAFVPKRQRNQFIVAALTQEIRRLKLEHSLQASSGSWSTQDYPALATTTDVEAYVREMRASYQARSWDAFTETEADG